MIELLVSLSLSNALGVLGLTLGDIIVTLVRAVAVVDVIALVGVGVFLVDYHRHETPRPIQWLLWCYIAALAAGGLGVMINVLFGPPPTPGIYAFTLVSSGSVLILSHVAIKSIRYR